MAAPTRKPLSRPPAGALLGPAAAVLAPLGALFMVLVVLFGAPGQDGGTAATGPLRYGVSAYALADIPREYLDLYQAAGEQYGIDWAILAGIGKEETDHGRSDLPGVHSGTNSAGAAGPMQFLLSTWQGSGVDGNHDGVTDVYDPADAIPAAAGYLKAGGAPADYRRAIFSYNHADWYVDDVLGFAEKYRGALKGLEGGSATGTVPGAKASIGPDGLARAPEDAPAVIKQMITAGNELQGLPYLWGGGHGTLIGDSGYDCSGAVSYVLHGGRAGGGPFNYSYGFTSGALESWGDPGPGRWVTIYASYDHAFMYVAGIRMDTSPVGELPSPNLGLDGPRWRLGVRDHTGFVVRHPRGL